MYHKTIINLTKNVQTFTKNLLINIFCIIFILDYFGFKAPIHLDGCIIMKENGISLISEKDQFLNSQTKSKLLLCANK